MKVSRKTLCSFGLPIAGTGTVPTLAVGVGEELTSTPTTEVSHLGIVRWFHTSHVGLRSLSNFRVGLFRVLSVGLEQLKVLKTIVGAVTIYVVNNLLRLEVSPNLLLHHQAVFSYVALLSAVRMILALHIPVPTALDAATGPLRMPGWVGIALPQLMRETFQTLRCRTCHNTDILHWEVNISNNQP